MTLSHAREPATGESITVRGMAPKDRSDITYQTPQCLAVRSHTDRLQVVTLWQLLGQYAPRVVQTRVVTNRRMAVEEVHLTFAGISDGVLVDMVNRLIALPWVLDAWHFAPADDQTALVRGKPR